MNDANIQSFTAGSQNTGSLFCHITVGLTCILDVAGF